MQVPSISEWAMYGGQSKRSYDIVVKKNKIGYKYMINPNYSPKGKFSGSYSLMVFVGYNNKPSEVNNYGYQRLGSHKTAAIACSHAKKHFKNL